MKPLNYKKILSIDERSKVPISQQLFESFSRLIYNKVIFLETKLPSIEVLSKMLSISQSDILVCYNNLINERLITQNNNDYYVIYHNFSHDQFNKSVSIIDALKLNGYEPSILKFDNELITKNDIQKSDIGNYFKNSTHVIRIDYYANHFLFAVTYNYTPTDVIENYDQIIKNASSLNEFLKLKTDSLYPLSEMRAIYYPKHIANDFKVPLNRAGLEVKVIYYDDSNQVIHLYISYIINWYNMILKHNLHDIFG